MENIKYYSPQTFRGSTDVYLEELEASGYFGESVKFYTVSLKTPLG